MLVFRSASFSIMNAHVIPGLVPGTYWAATSASMERCGARGTKLIRAEQVD